MIQFFRDINSVGKYESKLLKRSWFFKLFTFIALLFTFVYSMMYLFNNGDTKWEIQGINSLFPYMIMAGLNIVQSIVSIFLASEYLKRDKQLDTSEVFYVRPLGNAEYLFGKIWGTLKVFFGINLIVLLISMVLLVVKLGTGIDYLSFALYFLLISVPTLVYIIGLSTFVMLTIRNQALTFVIVLGYIGLTFYYVGDYFYYVFDYLGCNIPMMQSTITGFANWEALVVHRLIYLFLGIGFILMNIFLFGRLPNRKSLRTSWLIYGSLFITLAISAGVWHIVKYVRVDNYKLKLVELNNKYVHEPKMTIDSCHFEIVQKKDRLEIVANYSGTPITSASVFTFSLNPGMVISTIKERGQELNFKRDEHLTFIDFGRTLSDTAQVAFTIEYAGVVTEDICYLDIPEEMLISTEKNDNTPLVSIGKRYAYQTENYTLLTPETYWYPRPGVSYSSESPDWQQSYFTHYSMTITPNNGLTPISQGKCVENKGKYTFTPEQPLTAISLTIGDYEPYSIEVDSCLYTINVIKGHNFFTAHFDSIRDTIPYLIREKRAYLEREMKLPYPFKRYSLVEVPAMFTSYSRAWTQAQEMQQPEITFVAEKGYKFDRMNLARQITRTKDWDKRLGDKEVRMRVFNQVFELLQNSLNDFKHEEGKLGRYELSFSESPYYIFPQMYNFRYNVYSDTWPVANRMMELYFQGNFNQSWTRWSNGISNDEKAILLMRERSFKDLLNEVKHRDLMNNFVNIQSQQLFAEGQVNMGIDAFRDSLINIIKAHDFRNLSFELLLDSMSHLSNTNLFEPIKGWIEPSKLPEFLIGTPNTTKVSTREREVYQTELVISNISDNIGYFNLGIWFNNDYSGPLGPGEIPRHRIIRFAPKETKRIVSSWEDEQPTQYQINTLMATNLPLTFQLPAGIISDSRRQLKDGEYPISSDFLIPVGEIIIDNEDSLFTLSKAPPSGFLNHWIDKSMDEDFKYTTLRTWRPPSRWTAATEESYYGLSVRSAYGIRSGDGSQYAIWKAPIKDQGKYELFYHMNKLREWQDERGQRDRKGKNYYFTLKWGDHQEEVTLDTRRNENGWVLLGTYDIDADTIEVKLSNKSELNLVVADAIRLVNVREVGSKNHQRGGRGERMRMMPGGGMRPPGGGGGRR